VNGVRTSYADVVEKTSPAVVQIRMEKKQAADTGSMQMPFGDDFFRQFGQPAPNRGPRIERGAGSGVIVNSNGTILTNNHVVDGAEKITVYTSDNKTYDAKVIGTDAPSDLAVIKIEAENLPFLTLGNSDEVRVGDIVLAIGNPLDIGETVTAGIISAKGRRTGLSDGSFEDFLQTDAPINRGNSGGPTFDLAGNVIGVNSAIFSPTGGNVGIGFAIPSNTASTIVQQLLRSGRVTRGWIGVSIQPLDDDLAHAGQVMYVLVAVDEGRRCARCLLERLPLGVNLGRDRFARQPSQMRGGQQRAQAQENRPRPRKRSTRRRALGEVQMQTGHRVAGETRQRCGGRRPAWQVGQARERTNPAAGDQVGDRRIDAGAQAEVVGTQQQFSHRRCRPAAAPGPGLRRRCRRAAA